MRPLHTLRVQAARRVLLLKKNTCTTTTTDTSPITKCGRNIGNRLRKKIRYKINRDQAAPAVTTALAANWKMRRARSAKNTEIAAAQSATTAGNKPQINASMLINDQSL
jgi:hypothetical protein